MYATCDMCVLLADLLQLEAVLDHVLLAEQHRQELVVGDVLHQYSSVQNSASFPKLLLKSSRKVVFLSEISSK